ncbi:MAG: Fic family protein [Nitrospira sp. BO4]|jgi:Fic family protein|nr:Fic family protein [Nitrospira sp. BO4]
MPVVIPPPDIRQTFSDADKLQSLFVNAQNQSCRTIIESAVRNYHHWDKFRHYKLPEGFAHTDLWAFIKFGRLAQRKMAPFTDKLGTTFTYWIPDTLLKVLNEIDRWSGGNIIMDHPGGLAPKEKYIVSSLMEEAIASSQLEGAATTRKVAKELLRSGRKPKNKSERMILNNWQTMQYVREHKKEKLTLDRLREIHQIITADTMEDPTEAGELRKRDDIVVEYHGDIVHTPPSYKAVPARLDKLFEFFNKDAEDNWIHPVIKGAMIHFWIAYDHPFTDGNGRTARALMYWYLLSRDYLLFEYLAFSRYIVKAPAQYVRAYLYTETDENDLNYFLFFQLGAIQKAFQELRHYLQRKQEEIAISSNLLKRHKGLNLRQKTLIYNAIRHPDRQYTLQAHMTVHGIVYETARQDLMELTHKGFFKKTRQGKEFVFYPSDTILDKLKLTAESKKIILENPQTAISF